MSSEFVREDLERQHHLAHSPDDHHGRRTALLIGILAAVLALFDMAGRSAQNAYLSYHISASNEYAFFQARQTRALTLTTSATLLSTLGSSPEAAQAAAEARAEATRITADSDRGNGQAQIQARAAADAHAREVALHRYEWFEWVTSALQIAIVLASVSVITRLRLIAYVGAGIGGLASLVGLAALSGMV